jgi:hypothetical protein
LTEFEFMRAIIQRAPALLTAVGVILLAAAAFLGWQDRGRPEMVLVSPVDGVCGGIVPTGRPIPIIVEIENTTSDTIRIVGWSGC